MTSKRQIISFCLAVVAVGLVLRAQSQTPTFRGGTDLVQLDVSVLDKKRQPVRGLTQADFTVFEDGKPQTVAAFSTVELPDVVISPTKWMRDVTPDVTDNEISNNRITLIMIDDMMAGDLWSDNKLKESATQIVGSLGPQDMAAVVYLGNAALSQELTSDRPKLMKAIARYRRFAVSCANIVKAENIERATTALAEAAPNRRKNAVLLTSALNPPGSCNDKLCGDPCAIMLDAMRAAQRANVNFYPVDLEGLRPTADSTGRLKLGVNREVDPFLILANNTGGKAIVNTNDFKPGIDQILVENKSYYLLGYRPTNVKADGTIRRLDVKVNRLDVEVRARDQYIAPKAPPGPGDKPKPKPPAGVEAIAQILPKTDLPLRIAVAPFAVPGKNSGAVAVALGARQPAQAERITEEVTLVVRAFTPDDGKERASADQPIVLNIPAARRGVDVTRYDLLARIDLPPGHYALRVSAKSTTLDKLGSVYTDVDIPDFAKELLSLSGVVMSVTPGVPAAPAEAVSEITLAIPTTEREFSRIDRVSAFLRVYQGGKAKLEPVTCAIRIINSEDRAVIEQTDTLASEQFATARAADVRFALPAAQLPAGDYLLSFEATLGKEKVRRDVRFKIK